jgi:hypothetical protein
MLGNLFDRCHCHHRLQSQQHTMYLLVRDIHVSRCSVCRAKLHRRRQSFHPRDCRAILLSCWCPQPAKEA